MTKKKRHRKERRRAERQLPSQGAVKDGEHVYIIGLGSSEDWEEGHGSLYYIEDKNGEIALPVFTTPEAAESYVQANFDTPKAYMEMLESLGANVESHVPPLAEPRVIFMPMDIQGLARAAALIEADYLIRGLDPDSEPEIMRLDGAKRRRE